MRVHSILVAMALSLGAQQAPVPTVELRPTTVLGFEGHVPEFGDDIFLPGGKLLRCGLEHVQEWNLETSHTVFSTMPWMENAQRSESLCGGCGFLSYYSHQLADSYLSPDGSRLRYTKQNSYGESEGARTVDLKTGRTIDGGQIQGELFSSHYALAMEKPHGYVPEFSVRSLDQSSSAAWHFSIPQIQTGRDIPAMARMAFQFGVKALAMASDGSQVAARWRAADLNPAEKVLGKRYPVLGDWLFVWENGGSDPTWSLAVPSKDGLYQAMTPVFAPNGDLLLLYPDRTELHAASDGHLLARGPKAGPPDGWLDGGTQFMCANHDTLEIWDTNSLTLKRILKLERPADLPGDADVWYDAISQDGRWIAAYTELPSPTPDGPQDEKILIYDLRSAATP